MNIKQHEIEIRNTVRKSMESVRWLEVSSLCWEVFKHMLHLRYVYITLKYARKMHQLTKSEECQSILCCIVYRIVHHKHTEFSSSYTVLQ